MSKSCNIVSDNGVIATVTFHSIEDKICKFFFNAISAYKTVSRYLPIDKKGEIYFALINKKVIIPSSEEIKINPPSRSAKLRAIKRQGIKKIDTNFLYEKFKFLLDIEKLTSKI